MCRIVVRCVLCHVHCVCVTLLAPPTPPQVPHTLAQIQQKRRLDSWRIAQHLRMEHCKSPRVHEKFARPNHWTASRPRPCTIRHPQSDYPLSQVSKFIIFAAISRCLNVQSILQPAELPHVLLHSMLYLWIVCKRMLKEWCLLSQSLCLSTCQT